MNMIPLGRGLLSGWLLLASFSLHAAQSLTLEDAIRLAVHNQPLLQSLDSAAAAAREAAVAEGQLPDPRLQFGVQNLPINRGEALDFSRDDMTMTTIGIMQEVIPQPKREAASRILQAEAGRYRAEQSMVARSVQRDVALAWFDVFESQQKTRIYRQLADELAAQRSVTLARISTGAPASGVLALDSQLSMTRDSLIAAQRDEKLARARLARWVGEASTWPLPQQMPELPEIPAGAQAAALLEQHPELESARQAEQVAAAQIERARAEQALDWRWEAGYGRRRSDLSDMVSFQVAVDLPWDRANRQDRRTAEKQLLEARARQLTEDRRRELAAALEVARAELEAAQAREDEHQQTLIPAAAARLELARAGYEAGKIALNEVWEARRATLEVEIAHWRILADRARAAVRLGYLLGGYSSTGVQP